MFQGCFLGRIVRKIFLSHAAAELTLATNITIFKASFDPDAYPNHRCIDAASTMPFSSRTRNETFAIGAKYATRRAAAS